MILKSSCLIPVGCSQRGDLIECMSVLSAMLFSCNCKPSCTSKQGFLKYAGLVFIPFMLAFVKSHASGLYFL